MAQGTCFYCGHKVRDGQCRNKKCVAKGKSTWQRARWAITIRRQGHEA